MQEYDDTEIVLFKDFGRNYRVSKYKQKRGGKDRPRTVYFLNKILFPSYTRIRIRISSSTADLLGNLSNTDGLAFCEDLIRQEICQGCNCR